MINVPSKFRYDINTLRGIAVLGVVFFHFKVPNFNGGFSGVDIFFVISGYLMTRIILNGIDNDNFSVIDFYGKRLKRIVPALLLLIIVITVIGFFLYLPGDFMINEKNAAASVLLLSNIFYWKNSGYFDPSSETNIFLHTWSLSVEWQFYLLYPLILLILNKIIKNRFKFKLFFVGMTLLMMVFSFVVTKKSPTSSFYLLPSRAWEMMFGGIAFFMDSVIKSINLRKTLSIFGYIALIIAFFYLKTDMKWPGLYTIVPVLLTFIIIISKYNEFTLLKSDLFQFFGKISYSLYLWHWPVYVLSKYFGVETNLVSILFLITVSILLAYLSYKYIEAINYKSNLLILSTMVVLAVTSCAFGFYQSNTFLFKPEAILLTTYKAEHVNLEKQFSSGCCFISNIPNSKQDYRKLECLKFNPTMKNILLIGDSHAAMISLSLRGILAENHINMLQATSSGCSPVRRSNGQLWCSEIMEYVYNDFIVKHAKKIDGIFLCANWIDREDGNNHKMVDDINDTIKYLNHLNIPVILIGQNETYMIPYTTIAAKEVEYKIKSLKEHINTESYEMNDFMKTQFKANYINIANIGSFPGLSKTGSPYMWDENHYTEYGADLAVRKILKDPITIRLIENIKVL